MYFCGCIETRGALSTVGYYTYAYRFIIYHTGLLVYHTLQDGFLFHLC